jgi:hypothetical protein
MKLRTIATHLIQTATLKHNHPTPSLYSRPQTGAPASQGRAKRARAAGRLDGPHQAPVTLVCYSLGI